jgi:hypothetical protein
MYIGYYDGSLEEARNVQTITVGTFVDSSQLESGTGDGRITLKTNLGRQIFFQVTVK